MPGFRILPDLSTASASQQELRQFVGVANGQPFVGFGSTGPTGARGIDGSVAGIGHTGATGNSGQIGLMGPTGSLGIRGLQGSDGLQGLVGPTGQAGPTGQSIGLIGATGIQGPTGPAGSSSNIVPVTTDYLYLQMLSSPSFNTSENTLIFDQQKIQQGAITYNTSSGGINLAADKSYLFTLCLYTKSSPSAYAYLKDVSRFETLSTQLQSAAPVSQLNGGNPGTLSAIVKTTFARTVNVMIVLSSGGQVTGQADSFATHLTVIELGTSVGPIGATGSLGATGPSGGPIGPTGITGAMGVTGSQGVQGFQGVQGIQGTSGSTGIPGSTGLQGNSFTGITGMQGIQGAQGVQGFTGVSGAQGNTGATGAAGFTGPQGPTGIVNSGGVVTDYLYVKLANSQFISSNTVLRFDAIVNQQGSVSYNTSNGICTLAANKSYICTIYNYTIADAMSITIVDSDTQAVLSTNGQTLAANSGSGGGSPGTISAIVKTTNVAKNISVLVGSSSGRVRGDNDGIAAHMTIVEVGVSSGPIGATGSTGIQGIQGSTGTSSAAFIATDYISASLTSTLNLPTTFPVNIVYQTQLFQQGSINYNNSNGIFTLSAGKTYEFSIITVATLPSTTAYIQIALSDFNTNTILSPTAELNAPNSTYTNTGTGVLNFIYKPSTAQTVVVQIVAGNGSGNSLRGPGVNSNIAIKEIGASAGPIGPTGVVGATGFTGPIGSSTIGATGPTGNSGSAGVNGSIGPTGPSAGAFMDKLVIRPIFNNGITLVGDSDNEFPTVRYARYQTTFGGVQYTSGSFAANSNYLNTPNFITIPNAGLYDITARTNLSISNGGALTNYTYLMTVHHTNGPFTGQSSTTTLPSNSNSFRRQVYSFLIYYYTTAEQRFVVNLAANSTIQMSLQGVGPGDVTEVSPSGTELTILQIG